MKNSIVSRIQNEHVGQIMFVVGMSALGVALGILTVRIGFAVFGLTFPLS